MAKKLKLKNNLRYELRSQWWHIRSRCSRRKSLINSGLELKNYKLHADMSSTVEEAEHGVGSPGVHVPVGSYIRRLGRDLYTNEGEQEALSSPQLKFLWKINDNCGLRGGMLWLSNFWGRT